jgi:hypothetical protein
MSTTTTMPATSPMPVAPVWIEAEEYGDAHRAAFGAALRERLDLEAVLAGMEIAAAILRGDLRWAKQAARELAQVDGDARAWAARCERVAGAAFDILPMPCWVVGPTEAEALSAVDRAGGSAR